jgi:hypothetical protein
MTFESSQVYRAKVDFDAGFLEAEFRIRVIEARTRSLKSKSVKITGVSLYLITNLRRIIIMFYVILLLLLLLLLLRQPKAEAVKEVRQLLATSHRV